MDHNEPWLVRRRHLVDNDEQVAAMIEAQEAADAAAEEAPEVVPHVITVASLPHATATPLAAGAQVALLPHAAAVPLPWGSSVAAF